MPEVVIVPTGTANIASVCAAFERLGAAVTIAQTPERIREASHVMLPGVGAFGASKAMLVRHGFDRALTDRIAADAPTMCICVGHQLLFEASEETPEVDGLRVVPGRVSAFPQDVRSPQFGWNEVRAAYECRLLDSGWGYFANSFRATEAPGWAVAEAEHGGGFVAAMERGNLIGCQFHPELSGAYGTALLSRFLEL